MNSRSEKTIKCWRKPVVFTLSKEQISVHIKAAADSGTLGCAHAVAR